MLSSFLASLRHAIYNCTIGFYTRHHALRRTHPRSARALTLAALFPIFGVVAAFGFAPLAPDPALAPKYQVEVALAPLSLGAQIQSLDLAPAVYERAERVGRGDTLGTMLTRLGVEDATAENFMRASPAAHGLYQLRPGRTITVETDERGNLFRLAYDEPAAAAADPLAAGSSASLVVARQAEGFTAREEVLPNDRTVELREGEIATSLFAATDAAAVPESVASQIADIFAGDIDFYRDLRRGDRFRVVFESYQHSGQVVHTGRVLAVEFVVAGKSHQAVWYQPVGQSGNYYGFDGHSLRRAFLRAPLSFTRISSGFGGRVHPILNIWKWHTGIDYAAPIGTPIRATADGVVKFVGQQTGYGNAIELKHQGVYSTLYGHLSAFAHGLHAGQSVTQGDVIGYVGMTGWATGPHLHYEFRINGVAKDPLHVAMPDATPVARDQLAAFHRDIAPIDKAILRMRETDLSAAALSAGPPQT
jgi:murein DD-endopeptidase MepM/ murein hydrolase activator NlpD